MVTALSITAILLLSGCIEAGEPLMDTYGREGDWGVVHDFTLLDQHGENFTFSDVDSKVVVVMFIFTRCPDTCPVVTQNLVQTGEELGAKKSEVTFISISVDPEYDTPERLLTYSQTHAADWPHLTGPLEDLEAVWSDFYIGVDKNWIEMHSDENSSESNNSTEQESSDEGEQDAGHAEGNHSSAEPSGDNYTVGHNTVMYLIDSHGKRRVMHTGSSWDAEEVAFDILLLINNQHSETDEHDDLQH